MSGAILLESLRFPLKAKPRPLGPGIRKLKWLREPDLNCRPSGYEPDELEYLLSRISRNANQDNWESREKLGN